MLTILTTTNKNDAILAAIATIERLSELVTVEQDETQLSNTHKIIVVTDTSITSHLDWDDTEPPYLFPELEFTQENLLAMIFYKLGNHQKAFEFVSQENSFYNHLLIATHLQFGYDINEDMYAFAKAESQHNGCIVQQYGAGQIEKDSDRLKASYAEAIASAPNDEYRVFTIKHFVNFLLDIKAYDEAEKVIRIAMPKAISTDAQNAMRTLLSTALMAQIKMPYDKNALLEVQELQQASIAFYEEKELKVNAGLLLIDASEIANFQEDFIASKNYINKAILYFKEVDIQEFLGEAGLRKATLLYTWSKNGSPQYYKPAINAFQDTLKVFKRDTHPQKFADVHHNLALIYSEIPVSPEEKPIWTAFCASSFKEVLAFYTKEAYPYENAMASHNYATALMNFPEAKLHNNLDKAFGLFEDALTVRTEKKYPFERALTLLNQLELYWLMHNEDEASERKKYNQMVEKATSIAKIVNDENLIAQANQHLNQLKNLKTILN
ncbi:hypothetical protein [uncultured Maribacter sp.]|uniref:hypothetical protein n=1 Tax=uncultured Maribacter sp. TaxID=431308 RepID=UPI0030D6EC10